LRMTGEILKVNAHDFSCNIDYDVWRFVTLCTGNIEHCIFSSFEMHVYDASTKKTSEFVLQNNRLFFVKSYRQKKRKREAITSSTLSEEVC